MGAPAARAAELALHWTEAGHDVTVLTGFPNHPTGVLHSQYRRPFRRLVMREKAGKAHILRTWLLPRPNRKAHERMLNYASFCVSASITGHLVSRPDVVIATSPQLLVGLAGMWLARWKNVPFVFEVRDLWPESLAAVGMGNEQSMLYRMLRRTTGMLYQRAQLIVVVTNAFRDHLQEHWKLDPAKISVVQNGVETDLFAPRMPDLALRRQMGGGEGKFLVCYVGTIGMAQGLATLLDAAAQLQQSAPHVAFSLIGEGADKERIVSLAKSRSLRNVQFLDQQPRERIPAYICAADAGLVLLKRNDLFKTVIPTKMLEFMSCGRPVVLGVDGEAREIVQRSHAGVFVEPESATQLAQAITDLSENTALCETMAWNGRQYALRHFCRRQTANEYIEILEAVLANRDLRRAVAA